MRQWNCLDPIERAGWIGYFRRHPAGDHYTHYLLAGIQCMIGNMFKGKDDSPLTVEQVAPWLSNWIGKAHGKKRPLAEVSVERGALALSILGISVKSQPNATESQAE